MNNFTYKAGTRIIFGRDSERQVGIEAAAFGKKVLLHYGGGSIKASGLYDRVIASLKKEGLEIIELAGVKPNPHLSLVREGIELCRRSGVDFVLAVGGGSVIDSAKAIAFGARTDIDVWTYYTDGIPVTEALPLGVILTLPAAGSEGSPDSVLSDTVSERKLAAHGDVLRPVFSILNPVLTMTLPSYQTACGITDMFAHIMERYFTSTPNVDFIDHLSEGAMRSILKNSMKVLAEPDNYDYRAEIMLAGILAHNGILGLGREEDWMTHTIEHELSALWDVTHGEGLAIMFPAWIRYVYRNDVPRFVRFAEEVFGVTEGSDDEKVNEVIRRMKDWYSSMGLKISLSQLECFEEDKIPLMAERCMPEGSGGAVAKLTKDDIESIFRLAI